VVLYFEGTILAADIDLLMLTLQRFGESVNAGLGCGLGCTPALFVTTAQLRRHTLQLCRYVLMEP